MQDVTMELQKFQQRKLQPVDEQNNYEERIKGLLTELENKTTEHIAELNTVHDTYRA